MHAYKMHACKIYACKLHVHKLHAHKAYACKVYAYKVLSTEGVNGTDQMTLNPFEFAVPYGKVHFLSQPLLSVIGRTQSLLVGSYMFSYAEVAESSARQVPGGDTGLGGCTASRWQNGLKGGKTASIGKLVYRSPHPLV